jgi:hypothetical protein
MKPSHFFFLFWLICGVTDFGENIEHLFEKNPRFLNIWSAFKILLMLDPSSIFLLCLSSQVVVNLYSTFHCAKL